MKIVVTQTRQVQQYEPRRIEVHIDTSEENLEGDWEEFVGTVVESIDRILWPENYVIDDEEKKMGTIQTIPSPSKSEIFPELNLLPELIRLTNIELKRLNWSVENARKYFLKTYKKRSRQVLSHEELIEFLEFLKRLPN